MTDSISLTEEDIAKFQDLYRKRFGKEIGYHEAYESYIKLITPMKAKYKPLTKEGLKKLDTKRNCHHSI